MNKEKINFIINILLVIFLLAIGIYIYTHMDEAKMMIEDPCKVCEAKTGGQCYSNPFYKTLTNYSSAYNPDTTQDK